MKNPFEVGDRVAVYTADGRFTGDIIGVFGVHCIRVDYHPGQINASTGGVVGWAQVNPKQCRRLIKRERRRIWISETALALLKKDDPAIQDNNWVSLERVLDDDVEFVEARRRKHDQ